jgi:threonine dehydrogenase-like Zn-dependent dehydrogenase
MHEAGEDFAVTREGLTVRIEMEWQVDGGQEERLTLHPPEGYVAVPRTLTVPESAAATAQIYAFGPNS